MSSTKASRETIPNTSAPAIKESGITELFKQLGIRVVRPSKREERRRGFFHLFDLNGRSGEASKTHERNRFQEVLRRIRSLPEYSPHTSPQAPYGTFCSRAVIGESGVINGGVYLSVEPREAVVVDDSAGRLSNIYDELTIRYVKENGFGSIEERRFILAVTETVQCKLRYVSEKNIREILAHQRIEPDHKVALDVFLKLGVGTDRHLLLLAAYLLEKAAQRGLIKGKVYFDRRLDDTDHGKEKLIYTSVSGDLFVFTPAAQWCARFPSFHIN